MKLLRNLERWHAAAVEGWFLLYAVVSIALVLVGLVIHSIH